MLKAATESARAWTAPALWRFDPALPTISGRSNPRTFVSHNQFVSSILRNEIAHFF